MSAKQKIIAITTAAGIPTIIVVALLSRFLHEECPPSPGGPTVWWGDSTRWEMKNIPVGETYFATIRAMRNDGTLSEPSDTTFIYQGPTRMLFWSDRDSFYMWWPFFEGTGTSVLDLVRRRLGTITGATWGAGREHFALAFDGVDDKVDLGNLDFPGSELSLGATIKVAKGADIMARIIDKSSSAGTWWQLSLYQTGAANPDSFMLRMRIRTSASSTPIVVSTAKYCIKAGTWHDICGRYDGAAIRLYVDGILRATKPCTGTIAQAPTVPVVVGLSGTGGSPFKGKIEDVRFGREKTR